MTTTDEQPLPRTPDEIAARLAANADDDDVFGFSREVLARALPYDAATSLGLVADGCTREQWDTGLLIGDELIIKARGYLTFAIGKIIDHRGISAGRSVQKLTEFAWLMGRDDVVAAMGAAGYAQYGAPMVRAFAHGMGWGDDWDTAAADNPELTRMAGGDLCVPGCQSGCGQ